jgi:serine/threonine protein phosphatase PrpC
MHRGPAAGTAVRGALPCSLTAGLWGVVSDGDACTLAARAPSAQAAAQALVDEAARRGSGDNVTVIAVRLPGGVPAAASGG